MHRTSKYSCPNCGANLTFRSDDQKMTCSYCDSAFHPEEIKRTNADKTWSEEEYATLQSFTCSSCGGELVTDENTVATFCPYCGNATILPGRVSNSQKPDAVIPFRKTKEDAKEAFLSLCKGKHLLPGDFKKQNQIKKITGIYVPYWLCSCSADLNGEYSARKENRWSDSEYEYTETKYYTLKRGARADFCMIPVDGSEKMDNSVMESIEPYNYSELVDFHTTYLSGFFADKYNVTAKQCVTRIRQRVRHTLDERIRSSCGQYTSVYAPETELITGQLENKYVLLPVWLLQTRYKNKLYTFAMNGQTGKMTGTLPVSKGRTFLWFLLIFALLALPLFAFFNLVGLIVAAVIGIACINSMKKEANTAVEQNNAESYINSSTFELYKREDIYLRSETSRTRKQNNDANKANSTQ